MLQCFTATTLPTSLAVGGVTSFVITFTPTASLGVKTATVTITSNDPDEGTYNFDIKAEVQTPAALTVAPGGITSNLKFWLKQIVILAQLPIIHPLHLGKNKLLVTQKMPFLNSQKNPNFKTTQLTTSTLTLLSTLMDLTLCLEDKDLTIQICL